MKKVLVLCTGNSCRSIIAEALINAKLDGVEAYSSGVAPSLRVHPDAKRVLEKHNIWNDRYHSKMLDDVADIEFDLVVTVCDHAKQNCPIFPYDVEQIHVGFEDPDGLAYEAFEQTFEQIQDKLLDAVKKKLKNKDKDMEDWARQLTPKYMSTAMLNVDEFLQSYSDGKCEFVDVRMDFEREVWDLKFGLKIPLNELLDRTDELPSDKLIILGCPTGPRSIVAWTMMSSRGFNVKFLKGGLGELTATLKGGKAKEFLG